MPFKKLTLTISDTEWLDYNLYSIHLVQSGDCRGKLDKSIIIASSYAWAARGTTNMPPWSSLIHMALYNLSNIITSRWVSLLILKNETIRTTQCYMAEEHAIENNIYIKYKSKKKKEAQLTNEIMAASSKIFTRRSSNCSKISRHRGFPVEKIIQLSQEVLRSTNRIQLRFPWLSLIITKILTLISSLESMQTKFVCN